LAQVNLFSQLKKRLPCALDKFLFQHEYTGAWATLELNFDAPV
jgi:hypothetical protein